MNADSAHNACDAAEEEWQQYEEWEEWRDNAECASTSRLSLQSELRRRTDYLAVAAAVQATHRGCSTSSDGSARLPTLHVSSLRAPPSSPAQPLKPAFSFACTKEGKSIADSLFGSSGKQGCAPVLSQASPIQLKPPLCLCGRPALWHRRRWVCGEDCCSFEHLVPPAASTPLCHCGLRARWHEASERFWCGSDKPARRGGCGLEQPLEAEPRSPTRLPTVLLENEVAADTAALLTAAAHGLGDFCFVAPSEHGLGLWSREPLVRGQAVVEYAGPRLSGRKLINSTYALEVPDGRGVFIDGNFENEIYENAERSPAIYANHSRNPNLVLQHWPAPRGVARSGARLWLVAREDIAAGRELRFDYEEGGSLYWCGRPPMESRWRTLSLHPPPPSGQEPTIDLLPALLAGEKPQLPTEAERRGWWLP